MKLTVHCLVKNEENFIWYAINSVIDFVDEILVWDNGSNDKTVSIIKTINSPKIKFKEVPGSVQKLRGEMLNKTDSDWIFVLDGDEIWYESVVREIKQKLDEIKEDVIVFPTYMLIGDIFHYQEEKAGKYKIVNRVGNYNLRIIRNTPGLHIKGVYPNEAYVNRAGVWLQNLPKEKILFWPKPYFHASFLKRSWQSKSKYKYELGVPFPKDFYYPEVFFKSNPNLVFSPWGVVNTQYRLRAFFETPLKKIKRKLI